MDGQELGRPDPVSAQATLDRTAGAVHERLRFEQDGTAEAGTFTVAVTAEPLAMTAGQLIQHHETQVVAGAGVAQPPIAQPGGEPGAGCFPRLPFPVGHRGPPPPPSASDTTQRGAPSPGPPFQGG